jgi:hypothetical protein
MESTFWFVVLGDVHAGSDAFLVVSWHRTCETADRVAARLAARHRRECLCGSVAVLRLPSRFRRYTHVPYASRRPDGLGSDPSISH